MKIKKIVLTGPSCCGKSTLTKELAKYYNTIYVEEYARQYISNLKRPYTYKDVELIAQKQIELVNKAEQKAIKTNKTLIVIDTYLIIIIVWFEVVFKKVPEWIIDEIKKQDDSIYLLCKPDLQWVPDPAREYGPEKQTQLFRRYEVLLKTYDKIFFIISGLGIDRLECAKKLVNNFFL